MRISDWSSDVCSSDLLPLEEEGDPEATDATAGFGWMAPVLDERFRRRFPKNPTVPGSVAQGDFYFGTIEERIDVPSLPVVFSMNDFRAVGEVVGDVASRILRTVARRAAADSTDFLALGDRKCVWLGKSGSVRVSL